MSIVICDTCERWVDSDKDMYCFIDHPAHSLKGGDDTVMCENCREAAYDREQERLMEDGPGPSLIEQQQAAYKIKHGFRS
jgi:hypothetical protein